MKLNVARSTSSTSLCAALVAALAISGRAPVGGGVVLAAQAPAAAALKIVVLRGEDAINIVQTKTAVAPIVQVVDANAQPVSGATVKFAVEGGRATFNGAKTLTMTTDATGRAAVSSLTPTTTGAVRITASATFQGHVATAVITETNFLTAAAATAAATTAAAAGTTVAAAAATGAAATGAATGGAAAGGAAAGAGAGAGAATGAGVSLATIGVVGGAIAGGTLVATELLGNASVYAGPLDMQVVESSHRTRSNGTEFDACTTTLHLFGTFEANVGDKDGGLAGEIRANWEIGLMSSNCTNPGTTSEKFTRTFDIVGSAASLQGTDSFGPSNGATTLAFSGAVNGNVLAGTWSIGSTYVGPPDGSGTTYTQIWPQTGTQVSLAKQ